MQESEASPTSLLLSKRAARRLIQRAFVLVGRDRRVREHIRAARIITLWVLGDWRFFWTVELDRGKIHFERRPAKRPDLILTWQSAEGFFRQIEDGKAGQEGVEIEGDHELRRAFEPVLKAFFTSLGGLLRHPVDEDGESLL